MLRAAGSLVALLLLQGCATLGLARDFTVSDFELASQYGLEARKAGKLPANDRWPECFQQIADRLREVGESGDTNKTTGIAQIAMRVHIINAKQDGGISAECAQVVLRLERQGIKLGMALFPGGNLAGSFLGKIPGL